MNKTVAMIAVVLGLLTAFFVTENIDGSDGLGSGSGTTYYVTIGGINYWEVPDIDFRTYSDSSLIDVNVYIEKGSIRDGAFLNCTRLERVYCSSLVTSIGESAFEGCTGLKSVYMTRVKTIGESAFMNSSVSSITVGSSLETIGDYAFANCKNLSCPILADTAVKTLGQGVFFNSNLLVEDIRKVTTIDPTAFKDANIRFIAMRTEQILFNNSPTRVYDDCNLFTEFRYHSEGSAEGVKVRVNQYAVMDPRNRDGVPIPASYSSVQVNSVTVTYSTVLLSDHQDCYMRTGSTTIRFQEQLGIDDAVVLTGSGYTLPKGPAMGSLSFLGWTVPGTDGYVSALTPAMIAEMWPLIEPSANYSSCTVTFDHSQLDGPLSSALLHEMEFTFGSSYPTLGNTGNMGFACWLVNGEVFEGGDEIDEFYEHTAKSVWAENGMFRLTVHGCSAEVCYVMETVCTSAVSLNEIDFLEPDDRILIGWSLTDGGDRIKADTLRLVSDTDVYPVTKNRARYTVTYMDGYSTIGTQTFFEGRQSAISVELPEKTGMEFVRWMCEGTPYLMGDLLETNRDVTFYSEWVSLPRYTVAHETDPRIEVTCFEGDVIQIGVPIEPPAHMYLAGWKETDAGDRTYADGESYAVCKDVSFSPIWQNCERITVFFHGSGESTVQTVVYSDEDIVLPSPEPRTGYTFSGWSLEENGSPEYHPDDSIRLSGDLDLYAVWTENGTFTVRVHDGISEPRTARIGEKITIELAPITREGSVLLGWSTDISSQVPDFDPSYTLVLCEDSDLYPVWERLFALTYHDGTDIRTEYHEKGASVSLDIPIRDGFEFEGWSLEPDGPPIAKTDISITEDVHLYAVWMENEPDDEEPAPGENHDGSQTRSGIGMVEAASATAVAAITALIAYTLRRN